MISPLLFFEVVNYAVIKSSKIVDSNENHQKGGASLDTLGVKEVVE